MDYELKINSFKNTILLLFSLFILFTITSLFLMNNETDLDNITNFSAVIMNIIAAATLSHAAKWAFYNDKNNYSAWLFLAIAQSLYTLADVIYLFLDIIMRISPYPSVADLFFLAYYPLFTIGLFIMFRPVKINPKIFVDILIVMVSSTLLLWFLIIQPTVYLNSNQIIESFFSISYIFLDILILMVIIILLLNLHKKSMLAPLIFFSFAMFSLILGDTTYAFASLNSDNFVMWASNSFYILSYTFISTAAISCYKEINTHLGSFLYSINDKIKKENFSSYIPLILVIIVYTLVIYYEDPANELLWGVGTIVVLVVIRQLLSINEIKNAQKSLKKSKDLILKKEEQLTFITDNMMDLVTETDKNHKLKFFSGSALWLLGYKPEDIQDVAILDYIHPDDISEVSKTINNSIKNHLVGRSKFRFKTKAGKYIWVETISKPLFKDDKFSGFISSSRDVDEQEKAKIALKQSEVMYQTIFENTGTLTIILDKNMQIKIINGEFEKFSGYSHDQIQSKMNLIDFIEKDDEKSKETYLAIKNNKGKKSKNCEIALTNKNGERSYFVFTSVNMPDTYFSLISLIDITDLKKSEKEKETMLKEIHHRVMNNLQIITSLLNLQSQNIVNKEDAGLFKETQNRIQSMAMIHKNLYQSKNISQINFKEYLNYLSQQLLFNYEIHNRVQLNLECQDIFIGIETAVPLGLLANELLTNSIKHAFPNERKGNINISLIDNGDNYEMVISDDGIGVDEDFNIKKPKTLGLQIINNLINQIDATMEISKAKETEFKIIFKELNYKERI
jgi:PAS domain S-box-containing protein